MATHNAGRRRRGGGRVGPVATPEGWPPVRGQGARQMTDQSKVAGTGASGRRRRPGRKAAALTAVLLAGMAVAGDAWADRIVLKSGEVIEGSIIEATRNTVIVLRSIGGMRQMPIEDIQEVRIDLARGEQLVGQLLGWSDGVYEVRSGDGIVRSPQPDESRHGSTAEPLTLLVHAPRIGDRTSDPVDQAGIGSSDEAHDRREPGRIVRDATSQ